MLLYHIAIIVSSEDGIEIVIREIPYPSPSSDWNFSE